MNIKALFISLFLTMGISGYAQTVDLNLGDADAVCPNGKTANENLQNLQTLAKEANVENIGELLLIWKEIASTSPYIAKDFIEDGSSIVRMDEDYSEMKFKQKRLELTKMKKKERPAAEALIAEEEAAAEKLHDECRALIDKYKYGYDKWKEGYDNAIAAKQEAERAASATLDLDIKMPQGGTILNYVSPDKLESVRTLKITGLVYETDLKIIAKCNYLKTLDLSHAYTTLSPQMAKQKRANAEFLSGMFGLMGAVADDKHKDYEMSTIEHDEVKMMSELLKSAVEIKKGEVGCIIYSDCIGELPSLETLILPYRLTRIYYKNFHNCPNLKNIEFPPYLEALDDNVFINCTSLEEIKLPATFKELTNSTRLDYVGTFNGCTSLKKIDMSLCAFRDTEYRKNFYDCDALEELRLPHNITKIVNINRVKGLDLYIPKSVQYINTSLENMTVHFKSATAPSLGDCVVKNCTVYIPKGSLTDYYSNYGDTNKYIEE